MQRNNQMPEPKLAPKQLRRAERTAQEFLYFFPGQLIPAIRRANAKTYQFLTYVLNSDLVSANNMLREDPGLLLETQSIGEHESVTGLQLACNLGDAGMCQMMLECAVEKMDVNFPSKTNQKKCFDEKHFDEIADEIAIAARSNAQIVADEIERHRNPHHPMSELSHKMDTFRKRCDAHGEMTPEDVINAFTALKKHWNKFEYRNEVILFFIQVIGYVERLTPAWFRQALIESIFFLLWPNNTAMERETTCLVGGNVHPIVHLNPSAGFGFDFSCSDIGLIDAHSRPQECDPAITVESLNDFIEQQNQHFLELIRFINRMKCNPGARN